MTPWVGSFFTGSIDVTVQTCGDLGTIRPLVEGQPSTEFPLQTVSVPSNVNSYASTSLCVSEWFPFIRTVWVLSSSAVVGPLFLFCLFSRLDGMTMSWRKQDKAYSIDAGLFYGSDPTCCCALFCPRNRLSHRVPRRPGPWASISWHPRHISRSDPSGIVVFVLPHSQVCSRICRARSVSRCRLASAVQCSCFNRS